MNFRLVLVLILVLFIGASFATLPRNPLQNDDASLYALAAKNAVIHNQWLVQYITPGDPASFLDKPPLGILLLAWPMKILGVSELTVHIPNLLYYLFLLLILFLFLSRFASKRLALYTTMIAATSLCLVVYSRAPKLDVLLTLFVMVANLSLYAFLKKNDPVYLIPFTLSLAAGTLTKSGFGLLFPGLTILFLLAFNAPARDKLINRHSLLLLFLCLLLFLSIIAGVLALQSIPLGAQFLPYLKALTIQSKYNTSYMGLGFYHSIAGFLLITLFPWSPLWLTAIKFRLNKLNLNTFCSLWFWSNVLFLLFFYRQNDLRTFTVFVPPLAILAAIKLIGISWKPRRSVAGFLWSIFFLAIFSLLSIAVIMNPVNPDGFSLKAAILPIILFTFSLIPLTSYLWKPSQAKFIVTFALICLSYGVLFYNTKPIADAFNPDVKWPAIIKAQRSAGAKFFIYRPPDRQLFFSPDLFYVDFMAGPADRYYWDSAELKRDLAKPKIILLSDLTSFNKLNLGRTITIARDSYSALYQIN